MTIRLAVETPDRHGNVRGAVAIELAPGWKTYWIDPGPAGLRPELDFSQSTGIGEPQIAFPAPIRFQEGDALSNGYQDGASIAFHATSDGDGDVAVSLLVGICKAICVPISARLSRDLKTPTTLDEAAVVDRAFLSLPPLASDPLSARLEGDALILPALPEDPHAKDLFVTGTGEWAFGRPGHAGDGWSVPVLRRPDSLAPHGSDAFEAVATGGGPSGTEARRYRLQLRP